jgi:hypothetical protein
MLAVAPGAVASDEVLGSLPPGAAFAVRMSAHAGHVVWSQAVGPGRHVLMRWHDGRVDRLPVAARAVPFDVDLGSDARGRPVAVYSRCTGETESAPVGRCDVYRLALQGGRERRVPRVSTATASEYAPAIWRGNLAYASSRTAAGPAALMLLRRGARRAVTLRRRARDAAVGRVGAIDLTSNAVVFEWPAENGDALLRRVPLSGGRGKILARSHIEEGFSVAAQSPIATPKETLWVSLVSTPCLETRIVSDRRGRRRSTAPMPRDIRALARDGTSLYGITSASSPCSEPLDVTLVRLSPLVFRYGA